MLDDIAESKTKQSASVAVRERAREGTGKRRERKDTYRRDERRVASQPREPGAMRVDPWASTTVD
jgi:hypothetical protein